MCQGALADLQGLLSISSAVQWLPGTPGPGQALFLMNEYSCAFIVRKQQGKGAGEEAKEAPKETHRRSKPASSHPAGHYLAPHVCIVEGSQHIWAQDFITALFQKHLGTRFIFSLSMQRAVRHKRDS